MLTMLSGTAAAQDDPVITADPASVSEEGEADITVSGENFTPGNSLFLLPCVAPDGDANAINGQQDCDIADLTAVTVGDDGTFTADVTYDIVECFAIAAGDAAQTEAAAVTILVDGAAGACGTDGGGSDTTEEAPATTEGPGGEDPLPETGVGTNLMIAGALFLLGAGYFSTRAGGRLGER
ncbi:MAG: hypothetical protein HKN26_04300 [Acidimicrobiales bacterium]|nr:hypothetical protein [Acidimicrobiales bacterium]